MRLLARRAHSRAELRLKLRRRGYEAGDLEVTLARLAELGYLDDEAYARSLAGRRAGERGSRAIAAELAAKGIGRDLIGVALASLGEDAELEAATRLLRRRPAEEAVEKSLGRLARKGFSREVIAAAWRRL